MPSEPRPTESRAATVLDSLVRQHPGGRRRSWQLRQLERASREPIAVPGPASAAVPGGADDPSARGDVYDPAATAPGGRAGHLIVVLRRRWMALTAALVALAVVASLVLARRPPPIDERLPMTAAGDASSDASASGDMDGGTTADPGGANGTGSSASGPPTPADPSSSSDPVAGADPASGEVVVHVAGAVASPGVVRLAASGRIVDAVAAAGGLRPDADPDRVNLAAPVSDGQRIVIPVQGQPLPEEVIAAPPPGADPAVGAPGSSSGAPAAVDLNSATAEQLDTLPGVGPATAAAILAHREERGPFRSVDDLIEVRGIGEAKLEALRELVVVSGGG